MNWSTRLRRWVRMRTPPVREASMKPTAATVLPAPVACSNQKRRLGARVLGRLGDRLGVLVLGLLPVLRLLVGRQHLVVVLELGDGAVAVRRPRRWPPPSALPPLRPFWRPASADRSSSATIAARVPERASTWWSLSSRAVEQLRRLLVEQRARARAAASSCRATRTTAPRRPRRARRARRRPRAAGRCRAPESAIVSPASRIGSRENSRARSRSVSLSSPAALAATSVVLAMGKG